MVPTLLAGRLVDAHRLHHRRHGLPMEPGKVDPVRGKHRAPGMQQRLGRRRPLEPPWGPPSVAEPAERLRQLVVDEAVVGPEEVLVLESSPAADPLVEVEQLPPVVGLGLPRDPERRDLQVVARLLQQVQRP
jgi:hypothetical protein